MSTLRASNLIRYRGQECRPCHGDGKVRQSPQRFVPCPHCGGSGQVTLSTNEALDHPFRIVNHITRLGLPCPSSVRRRINCWAELGTDHKGVLMLEGTQLSPGDRLRVQIGSEPTLVVWINVTIRWSPQHGWLGIAEPDRRNQALVLLLRTGLLAQRVREEAGDLYERLDRS